MERRLISSLIIANDNDDGDNENNGDDDDPGEGEGDDGLRDSLQNSPPPT